MVEIELVVTCSKMAEAAALRAELLTLFGVSGAFDVEVVVTVDDVVVTVAVGGDVLSDVLGVVVVVDIVDVVEIGGADDVEVVDDVDIVGAVGVVGVVEDVDATRVAKVADVVEAVDDVVEVVEVAGDEVAFVVAIASD